MGNAVEKRSVILTGDGVRIIFQRLGGIDVLSYDLLHLVFPKRRMQDRIQQQIEPGVEIL